MTSSEWKEVSLGQICDFKYGKSLPASEREPGAIGVYGSNGLVGTHSSAVTNGPTIVIGRKGSFGEVTYSEGSCWPIDTTYYVDSSSTSADLRWLYYRLGCLGLKELNRAAAVPGLNREDAYRRRLLLPPIGEQQRIAKILDQADALLVKRMQAIPLLDELTQSVFLDMFGDPLSNPRSWPLRAMGELFRAKPCYGTMTPASKDKGEWFCLRVANIQDWELDLRDEKFVDLSPSDVDRHSVVDGDMILARAIATEEHLGKSVIIYPGNKKWAFDSHLMRIRFNREEVVPEFVREALRTPGGRKLFLSVTRRSAVQYNINTKEIGSLRIPVPALDLQMNYLERVQHIKDLRDVADSGLGSLDELFVSLQARAFRGDL